MSLAPLSLEPVDLIPAPHLPLPVSSLRRVLALSSDAEHLLLRLGGVIARLAHEGVSVRVSALLPGGDPSVRMPPDQAHPSHQALRVAAAELGALDLSLLPQAATPEALHCAIREQLADADAVLIAGDPAGGPPDGPADGARDTSAGAGAPDTSAGSGALELLARAGAEAAATEGRLLVEVQPECVRVRPAPYRHRLRFVTARLDALAKPQASASERAETLHVLRCFAQGRDWPQELLVGDPGGRECTHELHASPAWTLASVVLVRGQSTPVHQHDGWGAAVTIAGVERNLRYRGRLPDEVELVDEQIAPAGSGYLFEPRLIHQAVDGTGQHTASLHFLVHEHGLT